MRYLFVLLLVGCAREGAWSKSGATDNEFHMDRGACIAQAEAVPGALPLQRTNVYDGCMQGRGWYFVDK